MVSETTAAWSAVNGARLSETLLRAPRRVGRQQILRRGTQGASELSLERLRLDAGATDESRADGEETVVVLQEGAGTFAVDGRTWQVSRSGVFGERATALYVPSGATLRIAAKTPLEAVLLSAATSDAGEPALVGPDEIRVNPRGKGCYAREVHELFVSDPYARRLMVGETYNPPGNWSSYPPHKHDGRDGELKLEEVYYYRIDPPQGFGHQMIYTADGESVTHTVRDGDAVLLPYGYHPVSAAPGYRLYYLWAIAGVARKLTVFEDPAHTWVHDAVV
ncbi:MAG TPA: 5-deoxy-glucuronate isomerase [Vicinamibacterales bacterium]|nr:5-deoxy-glucuronate isomerase [Vicinamibacterales bacterium]